MSARTWRSTSERSPAISVTSATTRSAAAERPPKMRYIAAQARHESFAPRAPASARTPLTTRTCSSTTSSLPRRAAARMADPCARSHGPEPGRREVVGLERLLGGALVPAQRARRLLAAPEVLGERHGVARSRRLEPVAREPVPEHAIVARQHGVRRLAHERVRERELEIAVTLGRGRARDELAPAQELEPLGDLELLLLTAQQRRDAVAREPLAEHARGAQHAL